MNNTWCVFAYRWSRTVGWPAGQQLRWLSPRHISSCSTWTASLAWRRSERRCFWAAGEGAESTPFPTSEGTRGRSYWREGWSLMTSWTRSAWGERKQVGKGHSTCTERWFWVITRYWRPKLFELHWKVNTGAETSRQSMGHICASSCPISFSDEPFLTYEFKHPWTDCVSSSARSSPKSLFNLHLLYCYFFPPLPSLRLRSLYLWCASFLLSMAAQNPRCPPFSCPHCPGRVRAQREDNRRIWTIIPLLILPIILCYRCTCSPNVPPSLPSSSQCPCYHFSSPHCYTTHVSIHSRKRFPSFFPSFPTSFLIWPSRDDIAMVKMKEPCLKELFQEQSK